MSKTDRPVRTARKGRRLSRDEARLWEAVMGDVRPLRDRDAANGDGEEDPLDEAPAETPARRRSHPASGAADGPPVPPGLARLPELAPGQVAGVDKRTATRMRRGQLAIDARIDLHGLTQDEGYRALAAFLAASQEAGRRCVLVITGKGLRPDGSVGVLRAAVPRWLNLPPNRARVVAFSEAAPKDGGSGALYVLLRRRR